MTVSDDARRRLDSLARATPEWRPWLSLVEAAIRAAADPAWESIGLSLDPHRPPTAPALAGAEIRTDRTAARAWVRRLLETAAGGGTPGAESLRESGDRLDHRRFLEAAVCQNLEPLGRLGTESGADPKALAALTTVAAMPVLQAAGRRLADQISDTWKEGYCPICGAWPVLAEVRGLERSVRCRCGRCGGDWRREWLQCHFCGNADHQRLGSLVSDSHGETRKVETCEACRGYVKTVTTLGAWPRETVVLEDLATVDLDVAALERGYRRPERPGYALGARLVDAPVSRAAEPGRRRGLFGRRR